MMETQDRAPGALIVVLLKIGDELIRLRDEEAITLFTADNTIRLRRLLKVSVDGVKHERDKKENVGARRKKAIIDAISTADAASALAELWWALAAEHGRGGDRNTVPINNRLLPEGELAAVSQTVLAFLQRKQNSAELRSTPNLCVVLAMWREIGGADEARNWVQQNLDKPDAVAGLIDGVMGKGRAVGAREWARTLEVNPFPDMVDLYELERSAKLFLGNPDHQIRSLLERFLNLRTLKTM
jgi:hypothetical protein